MEFHTQKEIAEQLGKSPSTVSRFLSGKKYESKIINNAVMYSTPVFNQIILDFFESRGVENTEVESNNKTDTVKSTEVEATTAIDITISAFDALEKQLKVKDEQITMLTKLLDQQQQLTLADKRTDLLEIGTNENMPQEVNTVEETKAQEPQSKTFRERLGYWIIGK